MHQGGDDLEDDFVIDDLVALSDNETVPDGGFFSDENDASGEDGEKDEDPSTQTTADPSSAEKKKRKRREREKERKAKVIFSRCLAKKRSPIDVTSIQKLKLTETTSPVFTTSLAAQSPAGLSDFLAAKQAKTFQKMTAMELDDVRIPGSGRHFLPYVLFLY